METFTNVIDRACEEPTLLDALSWISVWECERVIPEAHKFLNGEKGRESNGQGWTTCFKYLLGEVIQQYDQQRILRKIKGTK